MTHHYTTHISQSTGLACKNCKAPIPQGEEFAVVTTPSRPFEENCLPCTDLRLDTDPKARVDQTAGKHPGNKRQ